MKGGNRRCLKSRDQIHSNFEFCTFLPYCWTRKEPLKKSGFSRKKSKIWLFERDLAKMTKLCLLLGAIHVTHGLNNFNANAVRRKVFLHKLPFKSLSFSCSFLWTVFCGRILSFLNLPETMNENSAENWNFFHPKKFFVEIFQNC